ncbi:MAG TPA: hypothetical protein DCZ72_01795, partial [Armatimonadetes bacterium]|nr:hypothetical protein [Armatimonadota bacterium]
QYAQDYDETYPDVWSGPGWYPPFCLGKLEPYIKSWPMYVCPSGFYNFNALDLTGTNRRLSYGANAHVVGGYGTVGQAKSMAAVIEPAITLIFFEGNWCDATSAYEYYGTQLRTADRHHDGANFIYCDGHAKWQHKNNWGKNRWNPDPNTPLG